MNFIEKAASQFYHNRLHHPVINGEMLQPIPYLTVPFRHRELISAVSQCDHGGDLSVDRPYDVSEGYFYSQQDREIHGKKNHGAVDFRVPYGTEVVSPADGWAISSYYSYLLPRQWHGENAYYGLGNFIQIFVPENGRIVQLAHLSGIEEYIPFSKPVFDAHHDKWQPTNHAIEPDQLAQHPMAVWVSRGDPIGQVGFSGLMLGYPDYQDGADRPVIINPEIQRSWDIPHLHLEEASRNYVNEKKEHQRDVYDIYAQGNRYPSPFRPNIPMGSETLFDLDKSEMPKYS